MMRRHSFLLLAVLACACAIPVVAAEKPKISTVAPAGDLTAEVTAKIEVLQGALADNDSYSKAKMKVIPQNAGVLAVLAQGLAETDEASPAKASAGDLRDAAIELSKAGSFDDAKKALDKVKEANGGKASGSAKAEADWGKLGNFELLMKEINERQSKVRRSVTRALPANLQAASQDASVIAILSVAMAADTHEVKDKADVPKWEAFSADLTAKAAEVAAAIKAGDQAKAKAAFTLAAKSCSGCHGEIRDKGK